MARGRGGTGMAIALVLFAMLFVLSTVVAIIFYTEKEDVMKKKAGAEADLLVYRTNQDHGQDDIKTLRDMVRQKDVPSVVSSLRGDREWLISQIDPKRKSKDGIESTINSLLESLDKDSNPGLVNLLTDYQNDVEQLRTRAAAAENTVTKQGDKFKDYEGQISALSQKYQGDVAALKAQLAAIESDNKTAQSNSKDQFVSVQQTTQESAEKAKSEIGKLETELIQKEAKIRDLGRALNELRSGLTNDTQGPDPSLQPDGQILSSIPESKIVTINLSSKDRLFLGLTFEVFDKKRGVAVRDQFGDIRGKATIEVANIKENTTECRVVRQDRNTSLFEGDIIANVVYDKYRTYKFFVFGDFDINNDQRTTASEQRRIKSMIEQWGGKVAKTMSYDVDFLVLGQRPIIPSKTDVTDPREIERIAAMERKQQQYLELEGEARTFRIPILNQNRFLTLVGYYNRNAMATPFKIPDSQNSAILRNAADGDAP